MSMRSKRTHKTKIKCIKMYSPLTSCKKASDTKEAYLNCIILQCAVSQHTVSKLQDTGWCFELRLLNSFIQTINLYFNTWSNGRIELAIYMHFMCPVSIPDLNVKWVQKHSVIKHVENHGWKEETVGEVWKRTILRDFIAHGSQKLLMDGHVDLSKKVWE